MEHNEAQETTTVVARNSDSVTTTTVAYCASLLRVSPTTLLSFLMEQGVES